MSFNTNSSRVATKKKTKLTEEGSKPKKRAASCPSSPESGRASQNSRCSICLGHVNNKSYTNHCRHLFCFTCLLERSKMNPVCPLCKKSFTSIIHNVRLKQEYDEYPIPVPEPDDPDLFDQIRTIPLPADTRPVRSRLTGTRTFRRLTYQRDFWVCPLSDTAGQYRQTSPEFLKSNPERTQQLLTWLDRELNVLLDSNNNQLSHVLELIRRLITQFHIRSRTFRGAIQRYIGGNTEHFIHEFFQFARSPYDMYGFDENAKYQPRSNLQQEEVAVGDSSDEDVPGTQPNNNSQAPGNSFTAIP